MSYSVLKNIYNGFHYFVNISVNRIKDIILCLETDLYKNKLPFNHLDWFNVQTPPSCGPIVLLIILLNPGRLLKNTLGIVFNFYVNSIQYLLKRFSSSESFLSWLSFIPYPPYSAHILIHKKKAKVSVLKWTLQFAYSVLKEGVQICI